MKATEFRTLIKESIQEYIKEIDAAGNRAALEAKMEKTKEAIESRKKKINMEGLDEAYHDMMDKGKIKELTSEIKLLEKSLAKYGKMLEKMDAKAAPKQMEDEGMMDEVIDEVNIEETFPESGAQLEEESLEEAKKKPSAGMTKKEKSALSKKAHKGEDIGKKGKGFEKVAKAGEKQYGSKEAGEKVAAAAMWKAAAKKESVETEGEVLNESFLHMQKLAGLITETQYKEKVDELFGLGGSKTTFKKGDQVMDKEEQSYWYVKQTNVDDNPKLYLLTAKGTRNPDREDVQRLEQYLVKTSK